MSKINQISTIFPLFYCMYSSFICILVQLLVEYGNYSQKRRIQRCSAYERGGAYWREALISMQIRKDTELIRGRHLFENRRLLEEIRYAIQSIKTYRACFKDQFGNPPPRFVWAIHHLEVTNGKSSGSRRFLGLFQTHARTFSSSTAQIDL